MKLRNFMELLSTSIKAFNQNLVHADKFGKTVKDLSKVLDICTKHYSEIWTYGGY